MDANKKQLSRDEMIKEILSESGEYHSAIDMSFKFSINDLLATYKKLRVEDLTNEQIEEYLTLKEIHNFVKNERTGIETVDVILSKLLQELREEVVALYLSDANLEKKIRNINYKIEWINKWKKQLNAMFPNMGIDER